jgi:hypothetical protein
MLTNGSEETMVIKGMHIYWPDLPNEQLNRIFFDRELVWSEIDYESPTYLSFGGSTCPCPTISPGQSKPWGFEFGATAALEGYRFKTIFENGCYLWDER